MPYCNSIIHPDLPHNPVNSAVTCRALPSCRLLCCVVLCCVVSCRVESSRVVSCRVVLCCVVLCCVTACSVLGPVHWRINAHEKSDLACNKTAHTLPWTLGYWQHWLMIVIGNCLHPLACRQPSPLVSFSYHNVSAGLRLCPSSPHWRVPLEMLPLACRACLPACRWLQGWTWSEEATAWEDPVPSPSHCWRWRSLEQHQQLSAQRCTLHGRSEFGNGRHPATCLLPPRVLQHWKENLQIKGKNCGDPALFTSLLSLLNGDTWAPLLNT